MRKVNRAKRRKIGVWSGVAVLGTAIFSVPVWGNGGATANADGGVAKRWETAARDDGPNGRFWPRLGSDAIPTSGFSGNSGFAGFLADGVANGKTSTNGAAAQGRVESANFIGYASDSGFAEQEKAISGRTRLVDWTAPVETLETSGATGANGALASTKENRKVGEAAEFGANSENETAASRSKTPILRDEPVAAAQSGGSLAGALVSTFGALAIVLGAFFALVALLKRTGANGGGVGSALEIVDSTPVGDKARLLTIRWGNRLILAAKTPEKIASLAEITDVDEANALLAEIERRKENAKIGKVGEKTAAIWKRGRDAASVWRTAFASKGRRQ